MTVLQDDDGPGTRPVICQDPVTGREERLHRLGEVTEGKLILKKTRRGVDLHWEGISLNEALGDELFITTQVARTLTTLRQGRRIPKEAFLAEHVERNWKNRDVFWLCTLAPGEYRVREEYDAKSVLYQVEEVSPRPPRVQQVKLIRRDR